MQGGKEEPPGAEFGVGKVGDQDEGDGEEDGQGDGEVVERVDGYLLVGDVGPSQVGVVEVRRDVALVRLHRFKVELPRPSMSIKRSQTGMARQRTFASRMATMPVPQSTMYALHHHIDPSPSPALSLESSRWTWPRRPTGGSSSVGSRGMAGSWA